MKILFRHNFESVDQELHFLAILKNFWSDPHKFSFLATKMFQKVMSQNSVKTVNTFCCCNQYMIYTNYLVFVAPTSNEKICFRNGPLSLNCDLVILRSIKSFKTIKTYTIYCSDHWKQGGTSNVFQFFVFHAKSNSKKILLTLLGVIYNNKAPSLVIWTIFWFSKNSVVEAKKIPLSRLEGFQF